MNGFDYVLIGVIVFMWVLAFIGIYMNRRSIQLGANIDLSRPIFVTGFCAMFLAYRYWG